MSFDRPLLLLVLLVVPAVGLLYLLVQRRRRAYAVDFTNVALLASVSDRRSAWRSHVPTALGALVLVVLVLAVAGPQVTRDAPIERATVILAIDTSVSMLSKDVQPTRLGAAKAAAQAFVEKVPDRLRVGLVLFAGDVDIGAPPTADREFARSSIASIEPSGVPGTAIGDAIARSVELGQDALSEARYGGVASLSPAEIGDAVSVLLLSDGRQWLGNIQPEEAANRARAAGIPVHTVALGKEITQDTDGTFRPQIFGRFAPDPETLEAIAATTGGEFFTARTDEELKSAYVDLGSRIGVAPRDSELTVFFVAGSVALLAAAGLLSAVWWPRLP